jgi:CSLREA domain-containing protein
MIRIGGRNEWRKHGPDAVQGRLRLRPTLMELEGRELLSTFTVNSKADDGSPGTLRWAIGQANASNQADTIVFSGLFNSPQTITLTGGTLQLMDTAKTTITAPGANLLTVDGSGGLSGSDFEVTKGAVAALSGLTITGGSAVDAGGGVFNEDGQLTMSNVVVRGNQAGSNDGSPVGGGLATWDGGTTTLSHCTISGNTVSSRGRGCSGGIYNGSYDTLTMTDCTISNNSGSYLGGGLYNSGKATLVDVTISGNSARIGGGGLVSSGTHGMLAMTGCTFSGNSAGEGGGLMAYQNGAITLTGCTVSGNFAAGGDPGGGGDGGGAANVYGTLTLANCTLSGNSASRSGGGLDNEGGGPVLASSRATSAGTSGGGQPAESTTALTNCTLSGNTAYGGAGGVANYGALSLSNTIVASNNGGDVGGSYTGSHNLIGGSPLLSALGNYGGPTATIALLPGSPAIGGGTSKGAPTLDQRGQPRAGHVDIGAFQSQGFTIAPVTGNNPQSTPVNQRFPKPLTFTVMANNPVEPVDGGIVRFAVRTAHRASATLSAATGTIAGGVASVTATANSAMGKYTVSATAAGADPDGFVLTNTERPSLVVTTTLDEWDDTDGRTSLREAIAYANSLPGPQTITFDSAVFGSRHQTIVLVIGPLLLTQPPTITIVGPGANLLTIKGGGKSQVFDVEGGSLALSGVTIAGGQANLGGGLRNEGGRLALSNVVIRGNRAIAGGGLFNDGRTTLSHVVIRGNRALVGCGLFNTRAARLLWRRSPPASHAAATRSKA